MCHSEGRGDSIVYLLPVLRRLRAVELGRPLPASGIQTLQNLFIDLPPPRPSQLSHHTDDEKHQKTAVLSGANPRLASAVHWVVMWPTTAEVRDPWTSSIRLSAPTLASDTHKTSAREWKHATGKCINVRETPESYKIICRHFVQHLHVGIQCKCFCMQVSTQQCGCACEHIVLNVSRAATLPSCGSVCVQTELPLMHTL